MRLVPQMNVIMSSAVLVSALLCSSSAHGADPAKERLDNSPRHHEWADIKTKAGRTVKTFVAYPEVKDRALAIVVIHENKGLTDWVRGVADQLAEAGYVAIAPDFLSQTGPDGGGTESYGSNDNATRGINALPPEQVLDDLDAAVAYAQGLKAANGKVAVAGFCWGGGKSFSCAAHNPKIAAAFVFYGRSPEPEALSKIAAPVYGFYGEMDNRITGQVPQVEKQMKLIGKKFEAVVYDGAGHGFMRSGEDPNGSAENKQAREQAWERWKETLKKL